MTHGTSKRGLTGRWDLLNIILPADYEQTGMVTVPITILDQNNVEVWRENFRSSHNGELTSLNEIVTLQHKRNK